jgi:N-formylglutamate deformylase
VFSSPHSGRAYSAEFLAMSRLDPLALRRSEDCFIDEIFAAVPEVGGTLVAADFPRAWCDPNREKWEFDPAMFEDALPAHANTASPRVVAGLGTVARVVSTGEAIYARKLRFAEAQARLDACWQPYHDILAKLTQQRLAEFGACLLVDCHSMPAHACQDRRPVPDIVLGDAYGAACAPAITRQVEHFLVRRGYVVRRNDPYAGGYVTRHYGRPGAGIHALQIEIARRLYMVEASFEKLAGFERLRQDMGALAMFLGEQGQVLMRSEAP